MNKEEKVKSVMQSPEIISATKMLLACMIDIDAKNFLHGEFEFGNENYCLAWMRKDDMVTQINSDNLTRQEKVRLFLKKYEINEATSITPHILQCLLSDYAEEQSQQLLQENLILKDARIAISDREMEVRKENFKWSERYDVLKKKADYLVETLDEFINSKYPMSFDLVKQAFENYKK